MTEPNEIVGVDEVSIYDEDGGEIITIQWNASGLFKMDPTGGP